MQVAQDTWSFPSRDPVVTPPMTAAALTVPASRWLCSCSGRVRFKRSRKSTGDRPAGRTLRARDIPARTDKKFLSDMVAGNKLGDVSASLTMADDAR